MSSWASFLNQFGSRKRFFDKEATIKEYFAIVPEGQRIKTDNYEELYQEAFRTVGKQDFIKNTADVEDYFHSISGDEGTIAVLIGLVAYAIAREVDTHGLEYEKAIDKILPDQFDTNNPFDVKEGFGHRIFGHDPVTFGIKNIPGDAIIKVKNIETGQRELIKIGEFLGVGTDQNVSMLQMIWKFYGNTDNKLTGVLNCLSHTIVHFSKDLLTPAGIPLPFVTLFNEYQYFENLDASALRYKDSLIKKFDNHRMQFKASDIASLMFIETFLDFYCKAKKMGDKEKAFRNDMKLIAMGTCISAQMATIVVGEHLQAGKKGNKPMIPGGKVNALLATAFFKETVQEMISIGKGWKDVYDGYELKRRLSNV